ncbi:MAG TPA: hypothetical protein G4N92_09055 [Anaerolineae bacterium]|nr:hypothetical protein [Anaerolineae bacterium]
MRGLIGQCVRLLTKNGQFCVQFLGFSTETYVIYTAPDSGWDKTNYAIYPDYNYNVFSPYLKNPNGYIVKNTQLVKSDNDTNKGRLWADIFKETIDEMLSTGKDPAFITLFWGYRMSK